MAITAAFRLSALVPTPTKGHGCGPLVQHSVSSLVQAPGIQARTRFILTTDLARVEVTKTAVQSAELHLGLGKRERCVQVLLTIRRVPRLEEWNMPTVLRPCPFRARGLLVGDPPSPVPIAGADCLAVARSQLKSSAVWILGDLYKKAESTE
jgi:hypothetical protein